MAVPHGNDRESSGGIEVEEYSRLELVESTLTDDFVSSSGGGLFARVAQIVLERSTVSWN